MARRDVWVTLLKARAIENLSFVAGANRIGTDGTGTKYCGDSLILNPKGEELASAEKNKECSITADISLPELMAFRKKFPAHLDADRFSINL
jgi:predicted amidohydrolase